MHEPNASPTGASTLTARAKLPSAVYLLAFSLFAMGSAEFLVAGVLPAIAADLRISLSAAGAVISAFAIGVVLGGPPLAVLTLRWPRRTTLIAAQGGFAAAVLVSVLTGSYAVLLATRFVAGLAYAGFFAVATVTAIGLVPPERTARASGIVVSGLTLAMIAGGPASALLSHFAGWRSGFWAVAALTLAGVVLTAAAVPATVVQIQPRVRRELRTMRQPHLWTIYGLTLLSTAAYMVTYNYLAAFLVDRTHIAEVWVPALLALFGIGAFSGIAAGSRVADTHPTRALLAGAVGIATSSILLAVLAGQAVAVIPLILLLGLAGFVLNPAIYGRVFTIAAQAPTLAGSATVSSFQLGISLVPVLAGAALRAGAGVGALPWVGTGLALLSIPLVLLDRKMSAALYQTH